MEFGGQTSEVALAAKLPMKFYALFRSGKHMHKRAAYGRRRGMNLNERLEAEYPKDAPVVQRSVIGPESMHGVVNVENVSTINKDVSMIASSRLLRVTNVNYLRNG